MTEAHIVKFFFINFLYLVEPLLSNYFEYFTTALATLKCWRRGKRIFRAQFRVRMGKKMTILAIVRAHSFSCFSSQILLFFLSYRVYDTKEFYLQINGRKGRGGEKIRKNFARRYAYLRTAPGELIRKIFRRVFFLYRSIEAFKSVFIRQIRPKLVCIV